MIKPVSDIEWILIYIEADLKVINLSMSVAVILKKEIHLRNFRER